ncbi:SDR family NAD(P)-dependent oxidoreductase [Amycolatopsis sp. CA-126428]|uniref:SDR family NAD(P)-dependent oxidoreductase n=1 Tax=Amycolatopsis sp. CA-126428 TaxID=2073158 RepID=UPI000CD0F878|nr:SDR family oxidoreductase [Amycolatopsis sp. CA-126428]
MNIAGKTVVITGAGRGIGAAIAQRLAVEQPRGIVVSDIDERAAKDTAARLGEQGCPVLAVGSDVSDGDQVERLVTAATDAFGPVDVAISNAGVATARGLYAAEQEWEAAWSVNVMGHVRLAKAVLPGMVRRRAGSVVLTASAVGLLGLPGDAPYSVTKHATVGLAEWLAFTYRPRGVHVSALCPLGVRTGLLMPAVEHGHLAGAMVEAAAPIIEPAEVAEAVVRGIDAERFLILPHPEVAAMHAAKAADPDAWIAEQADASARRRRR